MNNQWIGQRPRFSLEDRRNSQWLEGIGSQTINRFRWHSGNSTSLKQNGTFGHPLLSGHNAGA